MRNAGSVRSGGNSRSSARDSRHSAGSSGILKMGATCRVVTVWCPGIYEAATSLCPGNEAATVEMRQLAGGCEHTTGAAIVV